VADIFPPAMQRPKLLEFMAAIDASSRSLRRDKCDDLAVFGSLGHVYAVPEGYQLYVTTGERPRKWTSLKKKLAFCQLTQDGDDEGFLILGRLPSKEEAAIIREAVGIRKARHLSEECREKLIAAGAKYRLNGHFAAKSSLPGTTVVPDTGAAEIEAVYVQETA
jgi:hypothetical protein